MVPLTNMLSSSLLEHALIIRDAVFAVDEAITTSSLAVALQFGAWENEAILGYRDYRRMLNAAEKWVL